MKIAYLILVHENPQHLQRLIKKLNGVTTEFFVHVDKKVALSDFEKIKGHNIHFLLERRVSCSWGDYTLVQATLNLMSEALKLNNCDYLILLSGACYPIKSNDYINSYLESNKNKEFIETFSFPNIEFGKLAVRLNKRWLQINAPLKNYKRLVQMLLLKIGPVRDYKKVLGGHEAYTGSQWWALTDKCAAYILEYVKSNPDVVKLFKTSDCPDESFIQTIVKNSKFDQSISHKITFTEWAKGKSSPSLISEEHLVEFSNNVVVDSQFNNCPNEKKEVLFARKFSPANPLILDSVDKIISAYS
jgi:hypothetical protein